MIRIYPLGNKWGLLINEEHEYILDTIQEARIMARKLQYAVAVRGAVTAYDDLVTKLNELADIFAGSGYDAGGSNPITTEDLAGTDVTPGDLAAVAVFVENINLFLNGDVPAVYDYGAAINAFRGIP